MENTDWSLGRLLNASAGAGLALQNEDGSFPGGHNGPWNERESPVRATSNWACLMLHLGRGEGNGEHERSARKALRFLLSESCREKGRPFRCREGNDPPNGLIGQAWALDALLEGYEQLGDDECLRAAEDVLLLHRFDGKRGLWHNSRMDGKPSGINNTLNQQVWFAYAALRAHRSGGNRTIGSDAETFFRKLGSHVRFDGKRIAHHLNPLTEILMPRQTEGYLSFLLFGLAKAHRTDPDAIPKEILGMVPKCVGFLNESIFSGKSSRAPEYAWTYNPTGFEAAHVIEAFSIESRISAEMWAAEQVRRTFDFASMLMTNSSSDPETLSSRICEACGLPDYSLAGPAGS